MSKVTYLFGAGASKHALPTVDQIPHRIQGLIDFLSRPELALDGVAKFDIPDLAPVLKSKRAHQNEMIETLTWMLRKSSAHASIDTFAKKLYIKGNLEDLRRLKIAMSVFFTVEQARNPPDPRYDSFYASILDGTKRIPDRIRIVSWNYDYQFEMAYSEYSDQDDIRANQDWLQISTRGTHVDIQKEFRICKLNGTSGFFESHSRRQYHFATNLKVAVDKAFVEKVAEYFVAASHSQVLDSALAFAWETGKASSDTINQVIGNTVDTVALVVIGYSFPFFNRGVDKLIVNNMMKLRRVYFQAPDAGNLVERFQALRDDLTKIELIPRRDCNQFLLPNEL